MIVLYIVLLTVEPCMGGEPATDLVEVLVVI